jgi:hypothetical protein
MGVKTDTNFIRGIFLSWNAGYYSSFFGDSVTLTGNLNLINSQGGLTIPAGKVFTIGEGYTLTNYNTITNNGTFITNGRFVNNGTFIDNGTTFGGNEIDLSSPKPFAGGKGWTYANNIYTINDGANVIVTGRFKAVGTSRRSILVATEATANMTLRDATIDLSGSTTNYGAPIQLNYGNLTITLEGRDTLIGRYSDCGIELSSESTLTINGKGSLFVKGGSSNRAPGIGGSYDMLGVGSVVNINGGTIFAPRGSVGAVGIGFNEEGVGATLNMNGNAVVYSQGVMIETTNYTNGILFSGISGGINGDVYGDVTLENNLTLGVDDQLNVLNGSTLTIPRDIILDIHPAANVVPREGSTVNVLDYRSITNKKINGSCYCQVVQLYFQIIS